jgi:hypothetical protein
VSQAPGKGISQHFPNSTCLQHEIWGAKVDQGDIPHSVVLNSIRQRVTVVRFLG